MPPALPDPLVPIVLPQVVRADGSTIKMRGLPFRASTEEVVSFFKGFHVLPDSLHLGVDNLGRPSGEGWITFTSQEEAKARGGLLG